MIVLLWTLLALFVLRVAGQALVAFFDVQWLPAMDRWYSGLVPYPLLLPAQLLIIALLVKVCADFARGRGFFVQPRPFFAVPLQGPTIPVFFHWVLAAFVIAVGVWHRRRLRA